MTTKVANYRRYLNYSQKQMADLLGVSYQAYWLKEKGKTPFTDTEKIKLVDFFKNHIEDSELASKVTIEALFFNAKV
ncbi:MAG: transcriptional regulator [Aerococcus sp.]|nr:transcriptional regulator [Aerococcus sp.]